MGNFPEHVTGMEPYIAGPTRSYSDSRDLVCGRCGCEFEVVLDIDYYAYDGSEVSEWMCTGCGYENFFEHYPEHDWREHDDV